VEDFVGSSANFKSCPKKRPHFWGHVSRGQFWKAMSGKAMQVTAPPSGAALREILTRECEGHCFGFAASYYPEKMHLPSQKWNSAKSAPPISQVIDPIRFSVYNGRLALDQCKYALADKCTRLHIDCIGGATPVNRSRRCLRTTAASNINVFNFDSRVSCFQRPYAASRAGSGRAATDR
jgi:hypothetical protein